MSAYARADPEAMASASTRERVEARVREFIERFRPRFLYVMFSGGKDSAVVLAASVRAAREAGIPVVPVYAVVPGLTHPEATAAAIEMWRRLVPGAPVRYVVGRGVRELRKRIEEVVREVRPPGAMIVAANVLHEFWEAVERWGLPSPAERMGRKRRGLRWCASTFKHSVFNALAANCVYQGGPARCIAVGVRRSESWYRARRWPEGELVTVYRSGRYWDVSISPILELSSEEVWRLAGEYGIAGTLRRLYEKWGNVPNCVVCTLRREEYNIRAFAQLPTPYLERALEAIEKSMQRFKPGTFVREKSEEWARIIREILEKRRQSSTS